MQRQRFYYLLTTITVDRPWFRDESFQRREEPYNQGDRYFVGHDYSAAVQAFEGTLEGRDDFCSEYISAVELVSAWADGSGRRTVRKQVHRARKAFTFQVQRCETERECFETRMAAREAEGEAGELGSKVRLSVGDRVFTNSGWATVEAVEGETVRVRLTAEGIGQPGVHGRIRDAADRDVFSFPSWCFKRYAAAAPNVQKCAAVTFLARSA